MSDVDKIPRFSVEEAVRIGRQFYGLKVLQTKVFPSYEDQNFLLECDDKKKYVLKIYNQAEIKSNLVIQNQALELLTSKSNADLFPAVLSSLANKKIEEIKDHKGTSHYVRLLSFIEGIPLAQIKHHSPQLMKDLGSCLGNLTKSLEKLEHNEIGKDYLWNMLNCLETVDKYCIHIENRNRRTMIDKIISLYSDYAVPHLPFLLTSAIHGDVNDYNILIASPEKGEPVLDSFTIAGIIDFGDLGYSYTISELAISLAYIMMNKDDPLKTAGLFISGYHSIKPLTDLELKVLFPMICMRLATSVCMSVFQKKIDPSNDYLSASEEPAWRLLDQLNDIHPNLMYYSFRAACGLEPCPKAKKFIKWAKEHNEIFLPICDHDLKKGEISLLDFSPGSLMIPNLDILSDINTFSEIVKNNIEESGFEVGIGKYDETRIIYPSGQFKEREGDLEPSRTVHLGLDIFLKPGSTVYAPLEGEVHSFQNNSLPFDYGPTIILHHTIKKEGLEFYTLFGHLNPESIKGLVKGQKIKRGEKIGMVGDSTQNGGWPPHIHFQIILDMLGKKGDFPGAAYEANKKIWLSLCPDPNLILGIPLKKIKKKSDPLDKIAILRKNHIPNSLSLSYKEPLLIVRGDKQYLYDHKGRKYLDAVNNVPIVGHSHPAVAKAVYKQISVLNTNTRYLHPLLVRYAERLTETMPSPLNKCILVNSGSEANDLALRIARNYTGRKDMIVIDGAYHGNLSSLIDISPYKFNGKGGHGQPELTQVVMMPDPYRGPYKYGDPKAGQKYGGSVLEAIKRINLKQRYPAAFMVESLMGCGGQIVFPEGYLREAQSHIKTAGGLLIVDEVQIGFARVGSHFWGFQTQNVIPDIVTIGKPCGNGFPVAAVVTTEEIAKSFLDGMEYFNSFGGNPVSCAAALSVLEIIEKEKLQQNALKVGTYLKTGLNQLKKRHQIIGDVRGRGLFLGIELVLDHNSLKPAKEQASSIVERMKDKGILISVDGKHSNVLKIKPPLVFNRDNADLFLTTLDNILSETAIIGNR